MAKQFERLEENHIEFIQTQKIFFVGTAGKEGMVNVSPKGMDSLRIIDNKQVVWLNLTGSGNETAAHVIENQRMTIMFCSFEKQPLILRLYGQARVVHQRDEQWSPLAKRFPNYAGMRQFFVLNLDLVQTSCGFAVPFYEYMGERPVLKQWAEGKGDEGIREYWKEKNIKSIDEKETGIFSDTT